jgi:hypothetical protein
VRSDNHEYYIIIWEKELKNEGRLRKGRKIAERESQGKKVMLETKGKKTRLTEVE